MSRTLNAIRKDAPEPDRKEPALAPNPEPHWKTARDGSAYVFPRTLDELRKQGREFGLAAVADVQCHCILTWLMNGPHEADLRNPAPVALTAVNLVRERDRVRLGMPRHDGKAWEPPLLDQLSPEVQAEAERTAAETRADWANSGRQHLGETSIRRAYQHLVGCPAFTEKYIKETE